MMKEKSMAILRALNAVSSELQTLLGAFLVECEADASVRCVAVTGAGRGFCAGL